MPRATTSAAMNMFRFAAGSASLLSSSSNAARNCPQCLRPFSSARTYRQSPRRLLQTEAYRPYTLDPNMPPPRNAGVPNTSIASHLSTPELSTQPPAAQRIPTMNQGDAQKPRQTNPTPALSSTASPDPAATKPRRSKLRPRKAAMVLTPKAVSQLRALLDQPDPKLIRVGVKNRGCSGLAYHLEFVDKPGAFDESVEQDGVKVLIDSKALFSIIGSEMDWIEDKLNERFIFRNPNISKSSTPASTPHPLLLLTLLNSRAMWLWRVFQHLIDGASLRTINTIPKHWQRRHFQRFTTCRPSCYFWSNILLHSIYLRIPRIKTRQVQSPPTHP